MISFSFVSWFCFPLSIISTPVLNPNNYLTKEPNESNCLPKESDESSAAAFNEKMKSIISKMSSKEKIGALQVNGEWYAHAQRKEFKFAQVSNLARRQIVAESLRTAMEQMKIRFISSIFQKKRNDIHDKIGTHLPGKVMELFLILKQFINMMPQTDPELDQMNPTSEKLEQMRKEWRKLKEMKLDPTTIEVSEDNIGAKLLTTAIHNLIDTESFEVAFIRWSAHRDYWRSLKYEWRSYGELNDIKLSQIPMHHSYAIENLVRSIPIYHTLNQLYLPLESERKYATLLLGKVNRDKIQPSDLTSYYKDIIWILIDQSYMKPIKTTLQIFNKEKEVIKALNIPKNVIIPANNFLNVINLFGEKYEKVQEINSLINFHPAQRYLEDPLPIHSVDCLKYAKNLSTKDGVLGAVVKSLLLSTIC